MSDIKTSTTRSGAAVGQDRLTDAKVKLPQRQLLAITHDVKTNGPIWSEAIFVPFVPDTVVIKQLAYIAARNETDTYLLTCSSLGTPFCVFVDGANRTVDINIDVRNKSVNSRWQFQMQNIDGTPSTAAEGKLGLILEFLQH